MHSQTRTVGAFALTACAVFAAVLCLAGCIPAEAIEQARTEQAICEGVAKAADASDQTAAFATVEYDAWSAQRYALEGEPLPEATEGRMRAAGTLPEGYGE